VRSITAQQLRIARFPHEAEEIRAGLLDEARDRGRAAQPDFGIRRLAQLRTHLLDAFDVEDAQEGTWVALLYFRRG
jgi:hypothetical protein